MKKLIIIFICLLLAFSCCACSNTNGNLYNPNVNVPQPLPPISDDEGGNDNDLEQDDSEVQDEQKSKKKYIISNVNNLRIRSSANSVSTTIGYLDKNDGLLLIDKKGDYYQTKFKEKTAYVHVSYCAILEMETASNEVESAIDLGSSLLGYPYVWGSQRYHWGNGKLNSNFVAGEFDCSAFVQYIYYKSNKVILDVTTRTQVYNGVEVKKSNLRRGDLMFFTNSQRYNLSGNERIGHVAIYMGSNYILHTASDHAVIEPISNSRWSYYITARRVV